MRRFAIVLSVALLGLVAASGVALADKPAATTFIAVLSSGEETGLCAGISDSARGVAVFHVTDEAAGTVEWQIVANNLPGTTTAAHIHKAPAGVPGPVVQPLPGVAGNEQGVIARGSFTNPALLAALRASPELYYVNVHTNVCPAGVIRGQFGDHGP